LVFGSTATTHIRTSRERPRSRRFSAPTSSSIRGSTVFGLVVVIPVRISAYFFLGFWFLYQLFEANYGIWGAKANGGGDGLLRARGRLPLRRCVARLLAGLRRFAPVDDGQALRLPTCREYEAWRTATGFSRHDHPVSKRPFVAAQLPRGDRAGTAEQADGRFDHLWRSAAVLLGLSAAIVRSAPRHDHDVAHALRAVFGWAEGSGMRRS
jgi:hypothetical protein